VEGGWREIGCPYMQQVDVLLARVPHPLHIDDGGQARHRGLLSLDTGGLALLSSQWSVVSGHWSVVPRHLDHTARVPARLSLRLPLLPLPVQASR
jgi:hypothetical protein